VYSYIGCIIAGSIVFSHHSFIQLVLINSMLGMMISGKQQQKQHDIFGTYSSSNLPILVNAVNSKYKMLSYLANYRALACRTMHTHHRFKIMLPNTDQAHEKYL